MTKTLVMLPNNPGDLLMATPAPSYLGGIAAERARLIEERLPAAIKALRLR